MIFLDANLWLEADSRGWWVLRVTVPERGPSTTDRFGLFTSPRHVLQQRAVELTKGAALQVALLDGATTAGDDYLARAPAPGEPAPVAAADAEDAAHDEDDDGGGEGSDEEEGDEDR